MCLKLGIEKDNRRTIESNDAQETQKISTR